MVKPRAEEVVSSMPVRQVLKYSAFLRAERKHAREAEQALTSHPGVREAVVLAPQEKFDQDNVEVPGLIVESDEDRRRQRQARIRRQIRAERLDRIRAHE